MFPSLSSNLLRQRESQQVSQEHQNLYNHYVIDNFVDSVQEMNDVVLVPSRLQDLEPNSTVVPQMPLNDDLYQYYKMINTVKSDLFNPSQTKPVNVFTPKRKISRQQRKEDVILTPMRKTSSQSSMSSRSSFSDLSNFIHETSDTNGNCVVGADVNELKSSQLTEQFSHHLHSLYSILGHFTQAADYITERYLFEVEVQQ